MGALNGIAPAPTAADEAAEVLALLRRSLETVLSRHYAFDQRRDAFHSPSGHSERAWAAYGELGLLSLGLPEQHGGMPGGLTEIAMAAELLGGALALEPYLATIVAARLLAAAGTQDQQAAWLPALAAGSAKAALAHHEGAGRLSAPVLAEARRDGSKWRLAGRKSAVAGGDAANVFIISARAEGEIGLFLAPAEKVARRSYRCFDWTGAADLDLSGLVLPAEARLDGTEATLDLALDEATALACADALGAIRAANRLTREHAATRRQFGRTLDSFQVLQHRLVDMAIAEELAAPITHAALEACRGADATARARAVSAAKVKLGESARLVGQQCVQLHGGMGLAQEYPASHYFARLGLFERAFGDGDDHLQRFASLSRLQANGTNERVNTREIR
nr:acyl-CoA dehydrogenase family protein [Sphingosinicella sp. CPCC 101087]